MEDKLVKIGKLSRAHGLKGEIRGVIEQEFLVRIKKMEAIFIKIQGKPLPYFIEELDLDDTGGCLFKFEEVNSRTEVERLSGKEFFISEKNLKKAPKATGFNSLAGFKLFTTDKEELGIIENVYEMPANSLAQVMVQQKEVLIPLTNETVIKVNRTKKEVIVAIPDGLMEIYLK